MGENSDSRTKRSLGAAAYSRRARCLFPLPNPNGSLFPDGFALSLAEIALSRRDRRIIYSLLGITVAVLLYTGLYNR